MKFLLIKPKFVPFKLQQRSLFVLYHLSIIFVLCVISESFLFVLWWFHFLYCLGIAHLKLSLQTCKKNIINNGGPGVWLNAVQVLPGPELKGEHKEDAKKQMEKAFF